MTLVALPMTEAAIDAGFTRDIYVSLGEPLDNHAWAVQAIGAAVSKLFGLIKDDRIRMAAAKSFGEIVVMLAADPAVCSGRAPNGERYQ